MGSHETHYATYKDVSQFTPEAVASPLPLLIQDCQQASKEVVCPSKYNQEKAHWHTLRHTYIVQSRLRGRDIKVVQQQTGDSLLTLLRVYSNLSNEDRLEICEERPIIPIDLI